jgi:TetR/AcrR family transcriptional repressor of nem operon
VIVQHKPAEGTSNRDRLLRTAFQLFHEQGYHATGVATILREAGLNPGSMYHFFSSKDELLLEVLEFALNYLEPMVMGPVEVSEPDPIERVFALLRQYRKQLLDNGYRMGCPIGNLALEVSDGNPEARALIHSNFENWSDRVEGWLVDAGDRLPRTLDRARLARFVLTVMEGGLMQARAAGSMTPFDDSVVVLRDHFNHLEKQARQIRTGKVKATKKKRSKRK